MRCRLLCLLGRLPGVVNLIFGDGGMRMVWRRGVRGGSVGRVSLLELRDAVMRRPLCG